MFWDNDSNGFKTKFNEAHFNCFFKRWMADIESRPAVKLGLNTLKDRRSSGPPKGKEWEIMFGKEQFKRR